MELELGGKVATDQAVPLNVLDHASDAGLIRGDETWMSGGRLTPAVESNVPGLHSILGNR